MRKRSMNTIATRRTIFASAVAAALLFFAPAAFAQPVPGPVTAEEVSAFAADITVNADGTISVIEKIDYAFPEPRHGIYRDLPLEYVSDIGGRYRIPLEVTGVSQDGRAAEYDTSAEGDGLRIKIGDPSVMIAGFHSYTISYTASGALRYFNDHDELYWNVTGDSWTVPIRRSSATVHAPAGLSSADLSLECFTGSNGSLAHDCLKNTQGGTAFFAADGPLTIVVAWPPGLVAKLLPEDVPWWPRVVPYGIPVVAFFVLYWRWRKYGRDPKGRGTIVVEYDPPTVPSLSGKGAELRPGEVGTLLHDGAGDGDIIATIVDLAVRGYVKIKEVGDIAGVGIDHLLIRTKDFGADPALSGYEQQVLAGIFSGVSDTVSVASINGNAGFSGSLAVVKDRLSERMVEFGFYPQNPGRIRAAAIGGGIAFAIVLFLFRSLFDVFGDAALHMQIAAWLCVPIIILFGLAMPRRTEVGVAALEHARGFKEYLEKAEKHRLEWQVKEGMFERFLPYAMALGVVSAWTKAFEGIALTTPRWYEGSAFSGSTFHPMIFTSSFTSFRSNLSSAITAQPSRGGSGFSGGFGGGGGGGGGGSW